MYNVSINSFCVSKRIPYKCFYYKHFINFVNAESLALVSLHSIVAAITCPMVPTVANAKATGADVCLGAAVWYTCKVKNVDVFR